MTVRLAADEPSQNRNGETYEATAEHGHEQEAFLQEEVGTAADVSGVDVSPCRRERKVVQSGKGGQSLSLTCHKVKETNAANPLLIRSYNIRQVIQQASHFSP